MRIITHSCPNCGTIVGANVLEEHRTLKCPRTTCEEVLSFSDLSEEERSYFLDHREEYRI